MLPTQKTFLLRLDSQIEDNKAWLNSLALALIGNSLEKMDDEDEFLLFDRFKLMILELDSLNALSKSDFDEQSEDVVAIEISSFWEGVNKKMVRLPKNKKAEVEKVQMKLQKTLSSDTTINIAALSNILNELFRK